MSRCQLPAPSTPQPPRVRTRQRVWHCPQPGTCLGTLPRCGAADGGGPARRRSGPMASGRRWGMESPGEPAEGLQSHPGSCYRELSRFPAITRAALGAAGRGQAFLLYTGELGLARPRHSWHGRALTSPSHRVQPARPAPPAAPALQPALQPAAGGRQPHCQPGSAQRRDLPPVGLWDGTGRGSAAVPPLQPPCRPQASQPGLAIGAAPRRARPLPAAGPRGAGGNTGARGCLGRGGGCCGYGVPVLSPPPRPGVGRRWAQPRRGPDSAGEARQGLHRG